MGMSMANQSTNSCWRRHWGTNMETRKTYGILSSDDTMEFKTLSVAARRARLEASNLLRTSSCDIACSGVTSYGSLLQDKIQLGVMLSVDLMEHFVALTTQVTFLAHLAHEWFMTLITGFNIQMWQEMNTTSPLTWPLRWRSPPGWPRLCIYPQG